MFGTKNDFVEPEWRITKYRKSFLPFATSLWNSLDENTRQITNYESFKDTLMVNTIDNPLFLCWLTTGANNYGKIKNGMQ